MSSAGKHVRRWAAKSLKAIAILAVIGGAIYWMKFSPLPVHPHSVQRGTIVAEVMGTGTLEARVETTVSPKISGRIVEMLVDQGERVASGDLLVRLDDEELKQQAAIAKANVSAAEAAIARLKTDKLRATAVYTQAKSSHERRQKLMARNAVSQEDLDVAAEALAVAEAGVSRAEAAIAEGQKQLIAAETTLQYHQARLNDTKILAPFDGLVVKRRREPGDVVVPGTSILTIISTEELWISAWVDETEMAGLKTDQPARIIFRSEPSQAFSGKVARLGKETDRETREFIVDVRLLQLPANWAVGQRAEAYIQIAKKDDVLLMPASLLVKRDNDAGVFVDVEGTAQWRPVSLGLRSRDVAEVLEGVDAGDVVVNPASPSAVLTNGRRITLP